MSIFNWFKKKIEEQDTVQSQNLKFVEQQPATATIKKPKKPRKPKAKKEKVVQPKVEPKVDILKFNFDPKDPRLGSIELDWNSEFVELLTQHGYFGNSEEEIVDKWLNDVCRTIIANQFPGAVASASSLSNGTMVNRKSLGDGKTEIS